VPPPHHPIDQQGAPRLELTHGSVGLRAEEVIEAAPFSFIEGAAEMQQILKVDDFRPVEPERRMLTGMVLYGDPSGCSAYGDGWPGTAKAFNLQAICREGHRDPSIRWRVPMLLERSLMTPE
jgi:hypothetical protein